MIDVQIKYTRASAVKAFYTAVENEFDEGWKAFAKKRAEETRVSNNRLFALLSKIRGDEFVAQLYAYKKAVRAENARMSVVRTPIGIPVGDCRFALIPKVWIEQRECEDGKYAHVCIQAKPERWIKFVVWF